MGDREMTGSPTHKRELVAQGIAAGKTVERAMLDAGYSEKSAKVGMIRHGKGNWVAPMDHPEIGPRVEAIREGARRQASVTTADIARQLDEDREFAYKEKKPSAAIQATMGKAKVLGLIVDKMDLTMKPIKEMTEDELKNFVRQNGLEDQLAELLELYDDDDTVH